MKIIKVAFLLLLTSQAYSQGYDCKKCDPWKIACFDIDVKIPEPSDPVQKTEWKLLPGQPSINDSVATLEDVVGRLPQRFYQIMEY